MRLSIEGSLAEKMSKVKSKAVKKCAQRATSNVFAMFDQVQMEEFKETFNLIDQDHEGFIDKKDLHDMLASLGKMPNYPYLDAIMAEAPGAIIFTMFLMMFGEKLSGTDLNAFACFDEENKGFINEEQLRELVTTMGDRFTEEVIMQSQTFQPGDLILGKVKRYPACPARMNKLPEGSGIPKCKYAIFCYGTYEICFLVPKDILPYENFKAKFGLPQRRKGFEILHRPCVKFRRKISSQ